MTWIDIVLIIIVLGLIVHGIIFGLVRSLFDMAGIIGGYLLAINFGDMIRMPRFLAFLLIFVVTVIVFSISGRLFSKLVHLTPLGLLDRILGGVLGLAKGIFIGFVFLIILLLVKTANRTLNKSEIAPWVLTGGLRVCQVLPKKWFDWVRQVITKRELVEFQMPNSECQVDFNDQMTNLDI